ncbi:DUF4252 domain-containing protein [Colwellia sp. MB02u-14]|uniref:DUF4252 domain-containing protein n=1 Tax=Colwellia sp. MB02u-14 TaxID=2759815 RepID=UPI0015F50513|nr:DUF4252 domain-containing protein [Colwellia sp. MB02u-14]MBA6303220.1 DUF4252 domain-containing protein [Colwellia sp. MB02u-14]
MKLSTILLRKVTLILAITTSLLLTGCGITAGGLHSHAGYADIESPYWWQADSELNLSLGPLAIGTARWVIDADKDPEIDALLNDVDGVRISVYKVEENSQLFIENFDETQANLRADGWQPIARVKGDEQGDYSLMFIKSNGEVIDGLVVLLLSEDEALFVNIIGNIHPNSFEPIMEQVYKKTNSTEPSEEVAVEKI